MNSVRPRHIGILERLHFDGRLIQIYGRGAYNEDAENYRLALMKSSGKPNWWPAVLWREPTITAILSCAIADERRAERFGESYLALYQSELARLTRAR